MRRSIPCLIFALILGGNANALIIIDKSVSGSVVNDFEGSNCSSSLSRVVPSTPKPTLGVKLQIEYLAARPKADLSAPYIEGSEPLVSSAIQIYEIYKVVRRDVSEERAVAAVSALRATTIEPVAESLALEAADVALEYGLAMADAIIFATASRHKAEIVTGDADFEGLPRVTLIR